MKNFLINLDGVARDIIINIFLVLFLLAPFSFSTDYGSRFVGGEEFQVNTFTFGNQVYPIVAVLNNGKFVVTWTVGGDNAGIYVQIFNSSGSKTGSEFLANTNIINFPRYSFIAALSNGGFVITWTDGSDRGIYGQIFESSGSKVGSEFQVNTYTDNNQEDSFLAAFSNGNFVVTWTSYGQDGSGRGVYGQIFDSSGSKVGGEFQVNTYTDDDQMLGPAAVLSNNSFVVIWESLNQDGSAYGTYGQIFDSSGSKIGSEFLVNTHTTNSQHIVSVASFNNGNFVVTWMDNDQDGSYYGIYGQIFDSSGSKIGGEFQVNTYTDNYQYDTSIAVLNNDNFVVTWESDHQEWENYEIRAQIFDSSGSKIGDEFQVNTHTVGIQYRSFVATLYNGGGFVVVWQDNDGQDGDGSGIFGRIFMSDSDSLSATNIGQTVSYIEDIPKRFEPISVFSTIANIDAAFEFSDAEAGRLNEHTHTNATSTFDAISGRWHAWGDLDTMNLILGNLTFTPSTHYNTDFEIDVSITNGNGTITDTINVFGTPGNPVITMNPKFTTG